MRKFAGKAEFQVTWLPYQLAPYAPGGKGVNKLELYKQKFGDAQTQQMMPRMMLVGMQDGIHFSYGGNTGNTFDSHRLIALASKQGKQDELVEELFQNYFEQEKCISDCDVLLQAALKVGLIAAEELLNGDANVEEVQAEIQQCEMIATRGVPQFVINGRPIAPGAQDVAEFERRFLELLA
ncbi:unnamed protein product [Prorocentrum cordatum]|uniref:DSBA-like thioredoxin domain-containing protein n=1 Tax=Prorocentrum cordatum TaxID=2364126 RepID=A0ABN9SQQ1_9DINO|nr:unnamed protein product [Polarella glacialis]